MALYDDPEHSCDILGPPVVTSGTAGGDVLTWPTTRAAAVPCSINTTGASPQDRFSQPEMVVITHVVGFGPDVTVPQRGDKLLTPDGVYLHVRGLRTGRAAGGVPALTYADCQQVL